MLKRIVVVGLLAALAGSSCGPEDQSTTTASAARVSQAKQALLPPPNIPHLPPLNPCIVNPSACGDTFTNIHPVLGRGWNLISDQDGPSLLSCLEPYSFSAPSLTGATINSEVSFISDSVDLKDTLNLDGRASGGLAAASVPVSGTLYGDYSRTATATISTISLMVHSKVGFTPVRVTSTPKLTSGALGRFDTNGPLAFRNACGDKYVETATMGAELVGIIKISSTSTSVQSEIKAGLTASLGSAPTAAQAAQAVASNTGTTMGLSFGADGKLTKSLNGANVEIQLVFSQNGGPLVQNPTSLQDFVTKFQNFPTSITSTSDLNVLGVTLKPYSQTQNFGTRVAFGIGDPTNALTRVLGPAYSAYMDAYNELSFALDHNSSGQYFDFDANAAANLMDDCAVKLLDIENEITSCASGAACTQALETANIGTAWTTLRSQLPIRKQFYVLTGKQFKSGADTMNMLSSSTVDGVGSGADACKVDTDPAKPNAVRMWTASGFFGTSCDFKMFKSGKLAAPWIVTNTDLTLDTETVLAHSPSKTNMTLELTQQSYPWYNARAYFNGITLAGPQGDPSAEPWRSALIAP